MKSLTSNYMAGEGGPNRDMPKPKASHEYCEPSPWTQPRDSGVSPPGWAGSGADAAVTRRKFLKAVGASLAVALVGAPAVYGRPNDRVKVGFLFPRRGVVAGEAAALLAGFEFCLKEKGAQSVEVLRKDSGPDDRKILEGLAELLMKNQVKFLVCSPSLDGSEKVLRASAESQAIIFVTNPAVRLVAGELCVPSSFRLRANTYQSARPLAGWAIRNVGLRVFVTGDDDTQGNEEADFFAYGFEKAGGAFVDRVMAPVGAGNMKPVLDAVAKAKPDFVFASFRKKSAADFLKAYHSAKPALTYPVIGPESLAPWPEVQRGAGKAAASVRTLTAMTDPSDFVARVKKRTGKEVADAARAAEGYDIAQIVIKASQEVPGEGGDVAQLAKFIEEIELEGPRGKIRFDKNHEPILDMMVQEWVLSGGGLSQKIVENLGSCPSQDFGCGRMGFPKGPETESQDEEDPGWLEHEE